MLLCAAYAGAWEWWPLPMAEPDTCRDTLYYTGEVSVLSSSGAQAPSLLWHNRQGNIALQPHSGNLSVGIIKPTTRPNRWFDYDFGVVLCGRISGTQQNIAAPAISGTGYFRELYAHARLYIVDITAGIYPVSYGPGDDELSTGGLLFSNNTHPIPRITIGLERWTPVPGLFGYVEVKGGLTHGWLNDNAPDIKGTMLHHKFIGGRIGGKLPVNISYEFHHAAQWGGYSTINGDLGNDWQSFRHIFSAQKGGSTQSDQLNAQGNHILSQTLCLTVQGDRWHVDVYWQDIQEDGRPRWIGTGQNSKDGLWGVSVIQDHWQYIRGLSIEFFNTTDQSGPWHDRDGMVFGGKDKYYLNGAYPQGWTYFGQIMGLPFCLPFNSRVIGGQAGIKGDIYGYQYRAVCSHVRNYGTYDQPIQSDNTAVLVEIRKHIEKAWGLDFSLAISGDFGSQFGNRFGAMMTISKQGILKTY